MIGNARPGRKINTIWQGRTVPDARQFQATTLLSQTSQKTLTLKNLHSRCKATEQELLDLKAVKSHYSRAVDYRTYGLAHPSIRYNEILRSYIFKTVKKIKLQMKAHFFDPSNQISIIGFLDKIQLASNTNRIHEGVAMWVHPCFVKNTLAKTSKSWMLAAMHFVPLIASINIFEQTTRKKCFRFYLGVAGYLLKKFASDQAIAEIDSAVLCYTQLTNMTIMKYANSLYTKS